MSSNLSLSCVVWTEAGDRLYSFEQAAHLTQTSVSLLERFAHLGLIEPVGIMLRRQDIFRVVQIQRLHRDLNLSWVGAAIVLDMVTEIAQLKARLRAYRAGLQIRNS